MQTVQLEQLQAAHSAATAAAASTRHELQVAEQLLQDTRQQLAAEKAQSALLQQQLADEQEQSALLQQQLGSLKTAMLDLSADKDTAISKLGGPSLAGVLNTPRFLAAASQRHYVMHVFGGPIPVSCLPMKRYVTAVCM